MEREEGGGVARLGHELGGALVEHVELRLGLVDVEAADELSDGVQLPRAHRDACDRWGIEEMIGLEEIGTFPGAAAVPNSFEVRIKEGWDSETRAAAVGGRCTEEEGK